MIQQFHIWVFIWWKWNHYLKKISALLCSLQHYLQQLDMETSVHWWMIEFKKYKHVLFIYILFSHYKRKEILPFATTWMDLESIMLSEISQTEKEKYCMILLINGIWKKWTHRNREQTGDYRVLGMGGWTK